ncbi:MAG: Uncharacterized protein G01um10145_953 [Microgenomates group bacterium Gr01-1014_5]|nr:MAG: Uncharacterized protein G01um10145_953 [Microgenomates group bacterium Gr01-1014_5]
MSNLKDFITNFNFNSPDWTNPPDGFPKCTLDGLTSEEVGKFNGILTLWEMSRPKQIKQHSRVWKDPEGYKYLVPWSNSVLLRFLGRKFTDSLPKSEYRRKAQLDDCLRSVVRNIEEGFKRSTTSEYIQFLGYSQGSLEECKGDIKDLAQDRFLPNRPGSSLASIGINLKSFNESLKNPLKELRGKLKDDKGETSFLYRPLEILYPPLNRTQAEDLTIEIFLELTNKTDYLLRILVQSLEIKLKVWRKP